MTPATLANWLAERFPTAKRTTLRRWVAGGRVAVNGKPALRFNHPLNATDAVTVDDRSDEDRRAVGDDPKHAAAMNRLPFRLVYEDDDLLVVYKPSGLLTSTVPSEQRPTLLAAVRRHVRAGPGGKRVPVGLIHRLDRDASGLLVFSKTDEAYHALKTQFFRHDVERVYHAVCRGKPTPPAGRIESRLVERADGYVQAADEPNRGQRAVTDYETVRTVDPYTLVKVKLHTGRKHQIRVHLRSCGAPIVGDAVYGHAGENPIHPRLLLVATRLGLTHPGTKKHVTFEIPLPEDLARLVPENPNAPPRLPHPLRRKKKGTGNQVPVPGEPE